MITDNIIDLINFISDFITTNFPIIEQFFTSIDDFTINVLPDWISRFDLYMSYVYYFIPKGHLTAILTIVGISIFIRFALAIVNLIWP